MKLAYAISLAYSSELSGYQALTVIVFNIYLS